MLTPDQIKNFRLKARAKGFSEAQISAEIARKQQEVARVQAPSTKPTVAPTTQPVTSQPTAPMKEKRTVGGFVKNAVQDVVDFGINTPIQALKSVAGIGFEVGKMGTASKDKKNLAQKEKELAAATKAYTSEKDPAKKALLQKKYRAISDELGQATQSTLQRGQTANPFVKPEELPGSQKELLGGILKNVGRTFGLSQDETGRVVFNLDTAVQSAYEKPVTTALVAKDLGRGVANKFGKGTTAVKSPGILEKTGSNMRKGVLNPQAQASPFVSEEVAALQKVQEKLGLKGSAQAQLDQLPDLFRKSQKEIKTLLKDSPKTKTGTLSDEFLKQVDDSNYNLSDKQFSTAVESEMNILKNLDGKSALEQYAMLEKYRNLLKSTRKKIDNGTTLLPKEEARLAAFNALKASIDTVSPEVRTLNTLQNQMYNLSEGLLKTTEKGGVGLGPVKLPGSTSQALQDKAGQLLQGTAGVGEKIGSKIPTIPGGIGAKMAAGGALQVENLDDEVQDPSQDIDNDLEGYEDDDYVDEESQVEDSVAHPIFANQTKQEILEEAFRSGLNSKEIDEIEEIYDRFAPGEEEEAVQLTDAAITKISDTRSAIRDVQRLGEEITSSNLTGPLTGFRAKNPYDTDSRELQAEIDRVRQKVGKALEGGVLRKEDEDKYKKILPTMNDTKEVAIAKIEKLQRTLAEDLEDFVTIQSTYGKGRTGTQADEYLSAPVGPSVKKKPLK